MIMSEEQQQEVKEEIVGPGALLKAGREKAGLTVNELASKVRLRPSAIEDLEADKYDDSISVTFTKGYLKLYARHVNVPEKAVLDAFDAVTKVEQEPAKLRTFSRRVAKEANDDRLMMVTYLLVIIVIGLVVLWWFQQDSSESTPIGTTTQVNTPTTSSAVERAAVERTAVNAEPETLTTDASSAPLSDEQTADQDIPPIPADVGAESTNTRGSSEVEEFTSSATENANAPALASNVDSEQAELQTEYDEVENTVTEVTETAVSTADTSEILADDVSEEAANVPQGPLADPIELVFTFSDDCWMNLVDATGEAIAYGVKAAGRVMPVTGIPPFEVTLGAPQYVSISVDGELFDMSSFDGTRTARFTIPVKSQ